MDLFGKIIEALPARKGTSSKGEWQCNTYVIETQDRYPRRMAFDVFGADKVLQYNIQVGEMMTVSFDIDAHEYNGRWFNSIRAFNIARVNASPSSPAPQQSLGQRPQVVPGSIFPDPPMPTPATPADNSLPF